MIPELENLKTFKVSIDNHIAHLQLNRPDQLNSMNADFWEELPRVVKAIDHASVARVIVLSSTGKHFTAGMDLEVFAQLGQRFELEQARCAEALRRWILQLQNVLSVLERCRMPVLTAIQGGCIGGGIDMIAAADCRYCTADSFFVIKETELGVLADLGTLQRLPKLIPEGLVRELAYTSRKMLADEALSSGLVNAVYPDQESLLAAVMEVAKSIAAHSPLIVAGTKEMLTYGRNHGVDEGLNYTATWQGGMFRVTDLAEAMSAAQERRDGDYAELESLDFKL
ncbi:crotonase/enoyl-CoA hydratase family protein [Pseudomonadales bacterium]|nr:crotonase/enoyl-CoA hydratase family protein [Pseudomonadales bacterium]